MEISSTASSSKRLSSANQTHFAISDSQDASAFDLLLALPIAATSAMDGERNYDLPSDTTQPANSSCERCEAAPQQEEIESSDAIESAVDETTQANIVSSLAAIDAVAVQQTQPIDDPVATESKVTTVVDQVQPESILPAESAPIQLTDQSASTDAAEQGTPVEVVGTQAKSAAKVEGEQAVQTASTDSIQEIENSATENRSNADDNQSQQPAQSKQATQSDSQQEIAEQPVNIAQGVQKSDATEIEEHAVAETKVTPEAAKGRQQRERPARWYERTASESKAANTEAVQSPAMQEDAVSADLVNATPNAQNLENTGVAPILEDNGVDVNGEATIAESSALPINAANESTTATTGGVVIPSSANTEMTANSTDDTSRLAATSERVSTRTSALNESKLESSQTGPQVDVTRAEKAKLVQRVARSFSRIGPTGGNVQIKLHPPELGALAVQVRIEGKTMSARLTTESQAAKEVIMESLPQLRSRLAEQGYEVVQFTVDVTTEGSSLNDQAGNNQTGAGQGGQSGNPSDNSTGRNAPIDLRRSSHLRRQLDAAARSPSRELTVSGVGKGVDIQA